MNKLICLLLLTIASGCSSHSPLKPENPHRATASEGSSIPGMGSVELPKNYQGPFEIDSGASGRKAAKAYLPQQYETKPSWPLVVLLHGFSGTADAEDLYLGLRFRASARGFILLTPEGTITPKGTLNEKGEDLGGNPFWNATDACCDFGRTGVDDSAYLLALIENVKNKFKVDASRIYLIGHSNGGFMVNRLGCDAGGTFAGIANLAGGTYKNPAHCKSNVAVPYLHIHGKDDGTIRYEGTRDYAGAKETVGQWVMKNGCQKTTVKGEKKDFVFLIPGADTDSLTWNNCRSGKEVALWTIQKFQHEKHNAHIPLFQWGFMEAVLDFLLKQKN